MASGVDTARRELIVRGSVATAGVRVEAGSPTYDGVATSGGSFGFEVSRSAP